MRALLCSLLLALLAALTLGCAGSGRGSGASSTVPSGGASVAGSAVPSGGSTAAGSPMSSRAPGMSAYEPPTKLRGLKGDGDRDPSSDSDGYTTPDDDRDPRSDGRRSDNPEGYRDSDDLDSLRVGHPASPSDARAIAAVVKRYYAVAATGDGRRACSMMARSFARSVPIDYGRFGNPYLHGGKTCPAIASLQFQHARAQLTPTIYVTAVHVEHPDRAYALFGSHTAPASFIAVVREGGSWRIGSLMGRPEP